MKLWLCRNELKNPKVEMLFAYTSKDGALSMCARVARVKECRPQCKECTGPVGRILEE